MTQFNERKGYKEVRTIKIVEFEQEATSKSVAVTEKKGKHYARHIIYTYQHLPIINFKDEPVIRCDVPVVENTFVDDCK